MNRSRIQLCAAASALVLSACASQPQNTAKDGEGRDQVAIVDPGKAEPATAQTDAKSAERVVVTGALIATSPEDKLKPVESYTADQLASAGSPSVSEFVKNLSTTRDAAAPPAPAPVGGFNGANLRGLGAGDTMV